MDGNNLTGALGSVSTPLGVTETESARSNVPLIFTVSVGPLSVTFRVPLNPLKPMLKGAWMRIPSKERDPETASRFTVVALRVESIEGIKLAARSCLADNRLLRCR